MQKKIIAIAIAAALSTPAFADVTAYGIIDGAVANVSASGQRSDLLALSGGASTSRLGVKATEDLGDGLTAIGVLEYGFDTENSDGLATTATSVTARQKLLGVAGGFGTVATGYLQTTGYDFAVKFDPLAGSAASPLQAITKGSTFLIGTVAGAARAQRALAYISPNISGLTVAVNYSTALGGLGDLTVADSLASSKTTAYLVSGTYVRDALAVGVVYAATTAPTSAESATEYAVGGSYDLGVAKVLATYQSQTLNSANISAYSLSAVVPVNGNAVAASYSANTLASSDISGTALTVGYLHTLSKTTTAYAAYEYVTNGSATHAFSVLNNAVSTATLTNGGSSNVIAVGLRKKF